MYAKELKYNNWVIYNPYGNLPGVFKQVKGLNKTHVWFSDYTNDGSTIHLCNPIPITPEILEKCGFEYWTLDHDCTDPNDAYWVHKKMKFAINNIKWTVQKLDVKLSYLHQLQNLYFALTGEELEINL